MSPQRAPIEARDRGDPMDRKIQTGWLPFAGAIALALACISAVAQTKFPERPLRLVVPFAPGGVNDIVGRRYAQDLTRVLGQNVIVDNRGGASGSIGSADVARAKPDGHTLVIAN